MPLWAQILIGVGGLSGIVAAVRLILVEPQLARQSETKDLWIENRSLREELAAERRESQRARRHLDKIEARVGQLERQLLECHANEEQLRARITRLEA